MSGAKIIQALEEAARGDFSRVTTHGHVWIRDGVDKAAAWDAISEKNAEIERLRAAKTAALKIADERAIEAVDLRNQLVLAQPLYSRRKLEEENTNLRAQLALALKALEKVEQISQGVLRLPLTDDLRKS